MVGIPRQVDRQRGRKKVRQEGLVKTELGRVILKLVTTFTQLKTLNKTYVIIFGPLESDLLVH